MSPRGLGPQWIDVLPDKDRPEWLQLVGHTGSGHAYVMAALDVDDATELAARLILEAKRAGHPDPVAMTRRHYREARP